MLPATTKYTQVFL